MQTHIVDVGIDSIKINVKLLEANGTPLKAQVLPEELVALFQFCQEKACDNGNL